MKTKGFYKERLPSDLAIDFYKAFKSEDYNLRFRFLKKYFLHMEEENSVLKCRFIIDTPMMVVKDDFKGVTGFNELCIEFLNLLLSGEAKKVDSNKYSTASVYMGMAFEFGAFGIRRDERRAFFYYRAAANLQNSYGCFRLGQCYEKGVGTKLDFEKALTFYRISAKLGCVEALHTFGAILLYGLCNKETDLYGGLFYLQLAVKKTDENYPFTYFDFATCYDKSSKNCVIPDDKYAFNLYEKGAVLGCPNSQYKLARIFEFSELSTESDMHKALYWYQRASKSGHLEAIMMMANFYSTGIKNFLSEDKKQAYFLTLKAACKGNSIAAFNLGKFIEDGIGIDFDVLHALWWYSIAGSYGHPEAERKIDELNRGIGKEVIKKKSWIPSLW